jgi:DNA-directed RNA polymerase subunit RPC12/RpoP
MKQCFKCKRNLPLWLFSKNPRKYQRPTNKGRNYNCRMCTYKLLSKTKYGWLWNTEVQKFECVSFKSKVDIIKHILKK